MVTIYLESTINYLLTIDPIGTKELIMSGQVKKVGDVTYLLIQNEEVL
jgi:hypothetical protein